MFDPDLAIEMLALAEFSERFPTRDGERVTSPSSMFLRPQQPPRPLFVRGSPLVAARGLVRGDFKSDSECFVAHSEAGDVVVAFRSTETGLFNQEGAFKDWVLTDFRSNRIPYPPAPGSLGDRRWVHAGFWQAYEKVRNPLLAEVSRQAKEIAKIQRIHVTGFSLGGALALLAALDIAEAMPRTPVFLYCIAAPRAGDVSLNRLLDERVRETWSIGYGGDPTIHVPPIGPNLPITFTHLARINLAGIHVPLGNPGVPQLFQQYRTAGHIAYIDEGHGLHEGWPPLQVALSGAHHNYNRYRDALQAVKRAFERQQELAATAPRKGRGLEVIGLMLAASP